MKIVLLFTIIGINIIPFECFTVGYTYPNTDDATPAWKPWPQRGCPKPDPPIECVSRHTSCIHEDNTNVYRVVKTRTWWHCGK